MSRPDHSAVAHVGSMSVPFAGDMKENTDPDIARLGSKEALLSGFRLRLFSL